MQLLCDNNIINFLTVTATKANTATKSFIINKPGANISPAFVPGHLPLYPSVYANMKRQTLEILEVKYSESVSQ